MSKLSKLLKKGKSLFAKSKNFLIASFLLGVATIPFGNQIVYAGDGSGVFSGDGETVTRAGKDAVTKIIKGVGAFFVFISIVTGAIQIIYHKNNAEKRTGAMTGLFWVMVGALILLLATVITGFLWTSIGDSKLA